MSEHWLNHSEVEAALRAILKERILVIDGAMGTQLQAAKLGEADFRGERFAAHGRDLKGNGDILSLTRPEVVRKIHDALSRRRRRRHRDQHVHRDVDRAGRLRARVGGVRHEPGLGADRARRRRRRHGAQRPPRFVAGAIGPLNRTLSISPEVNDPSFRAVTFDQVRASYAEQIRALLDGGVDTLLAETVFDTLNLKACIFAIEEIFAERETRVPVMLSVTITDKIGTHAVAGRPSTPSGCR